MSDDRSSDRLLTLTQYRLTWKREGLNPKHKKYNSMKPIERMIKLLWPEPWTAINRNPDEPMFDEFEVPTVREHMLSEREKYPPIEFVKVTKRRVTRTPWVEA